MSYSEHLFENSFISNFRNPVGVGDQNSTSQHSILKKFGEKSAEIYFNDGEIVYYCSLCPWKFDLANALEEHLLTKHYLNENWLQNWKARQPLNFSQPAITTASRVEEKEAKEDNFFDSVFKVEVESGDSDDDSHRDDKISCGEEVIDDTELLSVKSIKKLKDKSFESTLDEEKMEPEKGLNTNNEEKTKKEIKGVTLRTRKAKKDSKPKTASKMQTLETDVDTIVQKKKHSNTPRPWWTIIENGVTRYKCHECEKHFATKGNLRRHEHIEHKGTIKYHICESCGRALKSGHAYRDHLRIHTGEKPYKCDECGKEFRSISHLRTVLFLIYCPLKFCCQCRNHKIIHSTVRNFACNFCDSRFHTKAHKQIHERIHTGEKPYQCDTCGQNFACTTSLRRHTKRHINERNQVCEICNSRFIFKAELRRHMKVHSNEREYMCYVCNAGFKDKRPFLQHSKTHQNSKEYRCKLCQEEFVRYSKIYHHIKTQHGETIPVAANIVYTPIDGKRAKIGRPSKMILESSKTQNDTSVNLINNNVSDNIKSDVSDIENGEQFSMN